MMIVRASRLAGMTAWTKLLIPDTMVVTDKDITVTKRKFLGLSNSEENVSLDRIASVRVLNGVLFSGLVLETVGGAVNDIHIGGLPKGVARQTAEHIRGLVG